MIRSLFRRLPPVARRDERISQLRHSLRTAGATEEAVDAYRDAFVRRSSFQARVHAERRLRALAQEIGAPSTSVIRHGKLHVYDVARAQGIEVPEVFGQWNDPRDIPWAELPDLVVIKTAFGSASRGVFPVRRADGGWHVVTHAGTWSDDDLTSAFVELMGAGRARPPFFAEEFLDEDGTGSSMPTDVKAYAFYGEVPLVLLRRPGRHGVSRDVAFRILDPRGHDVEDFQTNSTIDRTLPVPAELDAVVDAASRLSLAIRAPFSRLDFYCVRGRVVLGEVTPRPGGNNWFGPAVDERLGDAWDRAEVRLARDLAGGTTES